MKTVTQVLNGMPFDDMPDDLDDITPTERADMDQISKPRFASAKPATEYTEPCKKCGGTGSVTFGYVYRPRGQCFACKGAGHLKFKTSPESRAKAKTARIEREARELLEKAQAQAAWREEHADVVRWVNAHDGRFEFATSISNALAQYGTLTPGQVSAVRRCIERDNERKQAQSKEQASNPQVSRLHDVMQRHAKFYAGDVTLSRRNGDQLVWIKHANAEKVIGKIDNGTLTLWNRPGVDMDSVRSLLDEFEGAPLQAAMKYGRLSGRCCSCGRDLTNEGSVEAGIGPICATKFEE